MTDTLAAFWVGTTEYVIKRTFDVGHSEGSLDQHDGVRQR